MISGDRCVHSFYITFTTARDTRLTHRFHIIISPHTAHTSHAHKPHPLITPPSTAASRHACGRPRRGAVAAVLPHWSHDNGRLPGGRLTLQLPPPANGHGRGALCERRNGTASAQWAPRLPGQPALGLHPHALVRAAVDHFDRDRRGLWVRHADTRAQSNTHAARGLTVRRSPSGARVATWCHAVASWCHSRASWCDELVSPV